MNNCEWLLNMTYEQRGEWLEAEHVESNDAIGNESDVRPGSMDANDSREKLEADIYEYCDYHSDELETVKAWLNRQAAITEEQTRYKWVTKSAYEIAELKMNLNRANDAFETARLELEEQIAELERECDDLHSRIEQWMNAAASYRDLWERADARRIEAECERDGLAIALKHSDAEREHYRNLNSELMGVFDDARHVVARHEKDEGLA